MNNNYNGQPMGPQPMPNQSMGQPVQNQTMPNGLAALASKGVPTDKISIIGFIGAAIMALGSFLEFAKVYVKMSGTELYSASVNYFSTNGDMKDGVFILGLAIIICALIFKRKNMATLIPGGIALAILVYDVTDVVSKFDELKSTYLNSYYSSTIDVGYSFGPAVYLIAIGIILVGVHVFLHWKGKGGQAQPAMAGAPYQQPMPMPMPNQPMGPQPMNQPVEQPMPGQPMNYGMPQDPNQGMNMNNGQFPNNNNNMM